ncbi:BamA/TamA family outer membrane protein [Spirosoma soli]|uniref:BamA/TamA family outer membrane protein n=1 Tax=Spirosoma soli TaxID=1770529 RepID=A0ABW5M839_9BACT
MKRFYVMSVWITSLAGLLWSAQVVQAQSAPADSIQHRVILIGDAGRLLHGKNPVVDAVTSRYSFSDPRTTLLYLGDNIYPRGLSDESSPDHDSLAAILRYQARPGLARTGLARPGLAQPGLAQPEASDSSQVLFIPGNHDWARSQPDGWESIKRQGKWLSDLKAPNIRLLPADGCPGPEEVPLSNKLVLVVVDTQWWLHPYDKPGPESDCACKTEDEVLARLADIANRNKGKGIILATHHPFRSYGIHGGYYSIKQHIFPLTEFSPNLYIPLPVIGSIYPLVRGVFGNVQDLPHPTYKNMVRVMEKAVAPAKNVVFVSGHDHALQHIVDGSRNYIVSGSGINRERVKSGKLAKFVSPEWGYVVLDQLVNGTVTATFYTVDEHGQVTEAHSATLFTIPPDQNTGQNTRQRPSFPDSVRVAIAPAYDSVGRFHRQLLGNNYRREWATLVAFPVFDITRSHGGFKILQRGGGQQTKSLRLEDATGKEWVLRTIQKDPAQALPGPLRETIAKHVLQDEISASFPFGPLAVPPLAEAVGVPHANPTLVYVPDDPALGIYQSDFGNSVCLLEERSPGDGRSTSTPKVIEALEDDNDNSVDQRAVLRARMLDLFIGDWDRHEDQWRWGSRKTKTGKEFYPIPRDRDQVFFKAGGLLPTLAALPWLQPKFQGFGPKLANVNGSMFNARYVDRLFLQDLDMQDWIKEIAEVQASLTDDVLQRAINQLPPAIRQASGQRILETLKIRRGWLLKEGLTYYRFLAKAVDIPGSDKTELFRVQDQNDDKLAVSVFKIAKDGSVAQQIYNRVFDASVTKEIRLYGQKGNDRFEVSGPEATRIKVRLIGGKGVDTFTVAGTPAKPIIYDLSTEANELPAPGEAILRTSTDKAVNKYDPHAFKYDRLAPLATAGYNLDDGILLGVGGQWTQQGFRKAPYASMNRLMVSRALATEATSIKYDGIFTDLIGQNDLWLNAAIKAPDNVTNFFGIGNETIFEKYRGIRYYRTRYNLINIAALLKRDIGKQVTFSIGPVFQHFKLASDENKGRFIERYLAEQPESAPFLQSESYAGIQAGILLNARDNPILPARGIYWNTILLGLQGFGTQANHFTQIHSDLSLYTRLSRTGRVVITNRIGGGLTYGNPAFYQLLYLGGQNNLRGFRTYRFTGNHMVYHNIEARLKLFDFQSYLFPGSVGLLAFNDVGRVWVNGETSQRWHDGYGGGLYVVPAELLLVAASVGFSDEGALPYVSLGFRF